MRWVEVGLVMFLLALYLGASAACTCESNIDSPSPLCPTHGIEGWRDEPTAATVHP